MKYQDLGKVTIKHESGMAETNKGFRFPASGSVSKGDQLIEQDGRKYFVDANDFKKMKSDEKATKQTFQKGVTVALREQATKLGVEFYETTSKDDLVAAIEVAKDDLGSGLDV